jgi:hypothetical protein
MRDGPNGRGCLSATPWSADIQARRPDVLDPHPARDFLLDCAWQDGHP